MSNASKNRKKTSFKAKSKDKTKHVCLTGTFIIVKFFVTVEAGKLLKFLVKWCYHGYINVQSFKLLNRASLIGFENM